MFDKEIPKFKNTDVFDFSNQDDLKEIYTHFYKFDYAIRKLLPSIYKAYDIESKDLKKDF